MSNNIDKHDQIVNTESFFDGFSIPKIIEGYGCIYHLLDDRKKILYIGQTTNIIGRIGNHFSNKKIPFSSFVYRLVPVNRLNHEEIQDIVKYFPPYNKQLPCDSEIITFHNYKKINPKSKGRWVLFRKGFKKRGFSLDKRFRAFHISIWDQISVEGGISRCQ